MLETIIGVSSFRGSAAAEELTVSTVAPIGWHRNPFTYLKGRGAGEGGLLVDLRPASAPQAMDEG